MQQKLQQNLYFFTFVNKCHFSIAMSRSTAKGPIKNKGPTYRSGEIDCLLELTQEKIPISGEDWEDIA